MTETPSAVSIFLAMILAATLTHPATAALSPSDFFCAKNGPAGPFLISYAKAVKSCGDATVAAPNLCTMVTTCAYISEEAKLAALEEPYKKPFDQLTEDQKTTVLHSVNQDQVPSILSCPEITDNRGDCPLPENCKGDVLYNGRAAHFSDKDIKVYNGRDPESPLFFKPGAVAQPPTAPATSAKEAK